MYKRYSDSSAIVAMFLLSANSALSSEQGFTAIGCIELFEMEASGEGDSCALIGRKNQAEQRAIDTLEENGNAVCKSLSDNDPSFWAAYCQMVCENNGYEDSNGGFSMCSYEVTDTDVWEENGCFTGDRQHNRQEADVQCGCECSTRL